MSLYTFMMWLVILAAVVVLARVRGKRGLAILLAGLLLVVIGVTIWNVVVSSHANG